MVWDRLRLHRTQWCDIEQSGTNWDILGLIPRRIPGNPGEVLKSRKRPKLLEGPRMSDRFVLDALGIS